MNERDPQEALWGLLRSPSLRKALAEAETLYNQDAGDGPQTQLSASQG